MRILPVGLPHLRNDEERGEFAARPVHQTCCGCGATLLEYGEFFKGDIEWESRVQAFSNKVRDIS